MMISEKPSSERFNTLFFDDGRARAISVPDYQRAYSWELEQIELFIEDLKKCYTERNYYFGHFIVEAMNNGGKNNNGSIEWEVVDGQQRLTTFVLFLIICRYYRTACDCTSAYSLINRFQTVSYDLNGFASIVDHLASYIKKGITFNPNNLPTDEVIQNEFGLSVNFTHSQRRMVMALLRFHNAFEQYELKKEHIADYIDTVMQAHCSCHVTNDKSVAVNIFEMHNTRGVALSTLEILKAKLMQFVYSKGDTEPDENGKTERDRKVADIQNEFGKIYAMEEGLAKSSFRGDMSMDNLLRQHLRVIDDGFKRTEAEFDLPRVNANPDGLIKYVDDKLKTAELDYALNLAKELRKSVEILTKALPSWDMEEPLVGDVMILDRELSCQWFLLICRHLADRSSGIDGRVNHLILSRWERLLYTRNFHHQYYNLKGGRDNFPELFESLGSSVAEIEDMLEKYLRTGFRPDRTDGLQGIVREFLEQNKTQVLNKAFYWWREKMIYALYKYETSHRSNMRNVMKSGVSVEHILPQEWQWDWLNGVESENDLSPDQKEQKLKEVGTYINGIGNLLLLTRGENSSAGNTPPWEKRYGRYELSGSYRWHNENRTRWKNPEEWDKLIRERGHNIYDFILKELIDPATREQSTAGSSLLE